MLEKDFLEEGDPVVDMELGLEDIGLSLIALIDLGT